MLGSDIIVFEPNESTFAPLFSKAETCCRKSQFIQAATGLPRDVAVPQMTDIDVCSAIFPAEPTQASTRRLAAAIRTQR